ncbi:MAG: hypothetical protein ABIJ12_03430 [bacterium]
MKFLVILTSAIVLFFVIAYILWDVQVVDESEAIGSYVADYDIPLDSLELLPDGTCIHVYQLEGSTIKHDTTKWEYSLIEIENHSPVSFITLLEFLKVFNTYIEKPYAEGHIPRMNLVLNICKDKTIYRSTYKTQIDLDGMDKYHFIKVN